MLISRILTVLFAILALGLGLSGLAAGGTLEGFTLNCIALGSLSCSFISYQLRYILA